MMLQKNILLLAAFIGISCALGSKGPVFAYVTEQDVLHPVEYYPASSGQPDMQLFGPYPGPYPYLQQGGGPYMQLNGPYLEQASPYGGPYIQPVGAYAGLYMEQDESYEDLYGGPYVEQASLYGGSYIQPDGSYAGPYMQPAGPFGRPFKQPSGPYGSRYIEKGTYLRPHPDFYGKDIQNVEETDAEYYSDSPSKGSKVASYHFLSAANPQALNNIKIKLGK